MLVEKDMQGDWPRKENDAVWRLKQELNFTSVRDGTDIWLCRDSQQPLKLHESFYKIC